MLFLLLLELCQAYPPGKKRDNEGPADVCTSTVCQPHSSCYVYWFVIHNHDEFYRDFCICDLGWKLQVTEQGVFSCVNIDECAEGTHDCHCGSTCVDEEGTYSCQCEPGYVYANVETEKEEVRTVNIEIL